jgi:N-acetylmuramoyl-L-alanine amidase
VHTRSFFLKKTAEAGDRLVVDLTDSAKSEAKVSKTVADVQKQNRDLIIAIDAGHGGEDPGAVGKNKVYEKYVVLAIAKELAKLFDQQKGYKPVLIRSGDYYVGLSERRSRARKAHADLFVSIHADAFTNPQANGSSVYALSSKGATSASAKFLANKENQADLVGGVRLDDKDEILSSVLVDLSMTHKMAASLDVGGHVLGHMDHISRLHSKRVEQAAFAVLKTPDIPSILVETGFISNPGEAKKLASSAYQKKMAKAIYDGIHNYFKEKAPEDTYIANTFSKHQKETIYIVERGDTLSDIAERYAVSMQKLSQYNRLESHSLRIGQKLKIPSL